MAPRAAESAVATLGVPAAINARASNTWIEAVEADALQVQPIFVFFYFF
jgi:hypothetical protein